MGRSRVLVTGAGGFIGGIGRIMESDIAEPINLGSSQTVTINGLVDLVEDIAGIRLQRSYDLGAPKGVDGRSSDNTIIVDRLAWKPSTPLPAGMEKTYAWIYDQYVAREKDLAHRV